MKVIRMFVPVVVLLIVLGLAAQAQNKYVGVKMCSLCHKSDKQGGQFQIWQKTKHAEAYKTLATAKVAEIAKAKGIAKPAEAAECLDCHAKSYDATLIEKSYNVEDGVQCETCHGPGSAYKNMAVMKDKAKAVAAGLREFKDNAAIEAWCKTCHNEKSPTFKGFKFDEMWAKIKHPVPKAG
jgi:hypothetical protein